jgi:hypothetical protein
VIRDALTVDTACQGTPWGYLVGGRCPRCEKALTAFLTPRLQVGAPKRDEYLALLGALGGLVALAGAGAGEVPAEHGSACRDLAESRQVLFVGRDLARSVRSTAGPLRLRDQG